MTNTLRIVFMGTPDFAVGVLNSLIMAQYNVIGVITAPDRPAGRGRNLRASPVKEVALAHNLNLLQPDNLKDSSFLNEIKALNADVFVVVAFRMLPKVLWSIPCKGTFNLHASLLPQYRGAAPINWAIINGETKTGLTTFFIDDQIDTGAIIKTVSCPIENNENASQLHDKLMELGMQLVKDTLDAIETDNITGIPQQNSTHLERAPKLKPENTKINWDWPAEKINNLIRGLSSYPGAWTTLITDGHEAKVKIYQAQVTDHDSITAPGCINSDQKTILVDTANKQISIEFIQFPGKKKMSTKDLLNGFRFDQTAKFV